MYTTKRLAIEIENKEQQMTTEFYNNFSSIRRYIMTDFSLSHHQSLELLNELSDHILESQSHGTTAKQFFGDNLERYANDLVVELPIEKTIFKVSVIAYAVFNMIALLLIVMMLVELFINFMSSKHFEFYPIGLTVAFITNLFGMLGSLFILLKLSHLDEFKNNRHTFLKEIPVYISGGLTIFGAYMIFKNMDAGPKIYLHWFVYIFLAIISAVIDSICSKKVD